MRVHPAPKKRSITFRSAANRILSASDAGRQKKLRRLPHIFSKVLELPFGADADVSVHEDVYGFQFVVAADGVEGDVRAHAIEIHPGVMKVVIREGVGDDLDRASDGFEDDFELDRWRFRLPPSTRPALATANYVDGELVVIIPKGEGSDEDGDEGSEDLTGGGIGRLVAVQ